MNSSVPTETVAGRYRLEREIGRRMAMADVTVHLGPDDLSLTECAASREATGHLVDSSCYGPDD